MNAGPEPPSAENARERAYDVLAFYSGAEGVTIPRFDALKVRANTVAAVAEVPASRLALDEHDRIATISLTEINVLPVRILDVDKPSIQRASCATTMLYPSYQAAASPRNYSFTSNSASMASSSPPPPAAPGWPWAVLPAPSPGVAPGAWPPADA